MNEVISGFAKGLYHSLRVLYCFFEWNNVIIKQEKAEMRRRAEFNEMRMPNRSRVTRYAEAKREYNRQRQRQLSNDSYSSEASFENVNLVGGGGSSQSVNRRIKEPVHNFGMVKALSNIYFVNFFVMFISYLLCVYIAPTLFRIIASYFLHDDDITFISSITWNILMILWVGPLCILIEIMHYVSLRDIYKKINNVRVRSKFVYNIGHQQQGVGGNNVIKNVELIKNILTNAVFVPIFLIIFNLQGVIISWLFEFVIGNYVLSIVSCFLHRSLLYAFYSFEFSWILKGVTFNERLHRIKVAWPYFVGYGMPVGVIMYLSSSIFSIGTILINFLYPLFLIGACQVSWSEHREAISLPTNSYIRSLPISFIFEPSLYFTNIIVDIRFFRRLSHSFSKYNFF